MQALSMNFKPAALAAGLVLGSLSFNAQAALSGLVYSSISDVYWTKDANLFKTMYDADNTLISKIAAVTPTYNDPAFGLQTISDSVLYSGDSDDFDTSTGTATWWGALAFVNYLNHINYAGSNQWYLPTVANIVFGVNTPTNGTAKGDELAELFYEELGGKAGSNIPDTVTFDNERASIYWSGTMYAPLPTHALAFYTTTGIQYRNFKGNQFYVWAVSPGVVTSVPEADTTAMLLAGLGVIGAVLRRRHIA